MPLALVQGEAEDFGKLRNVNKTFYRTVHLSGTMELSVYCNKIGTEIKT